MSRAHLDYGVRTSVQREGFNPDVPIAGWYRFKLVSGGVFVAVKIWFGLPLDPIDGTELDRAPRSAATIHPSKSGFSWTSTKPFAGTTA